MRGAGGDARGARYWFACGGGRGWSSRTWRAHPARLGRFANMVLGVEFQPQLVNEVEAAARTKVHQNDAMIRESRTDAGLPEILRSAPARRFDRAAASRIFIEALDQNFCAYRRRTHDFIRSLDLRSAKRLAMGAEATHQLVATA